MDTFFLTSVHASVVLDGGNEDAEHVVKCSLGLVHDLLGGSAKDDCASLALGATTELDHFLLPDHHLLDQLAGAQSDGLGVAESGGDLSTGHQGKPLNSVEVGVLDGHHAGVGKQLSER